jgi:hypothetical protein
VSSWNEYQRLVLDKLEQHSKGIDKMRGEIQAARTDIATLKVKSGIWGFVAGAFPGLIALIYSLGK